MEYVLKYDGEEIERGELSDILWELAQLMQRESLNGSFDSDRTTVEKIND